ncbi:MAG: tetratricopeptide repeat protein [Bacteroidales bacterium]|nr:tetratricopeptide repeat protein [Bacteroidales bacterium]
MKKIILPILGAMALCAMASDLTTSQKLADAIPREVAAETAPDVEPMLPPGMLPLVERADSLIAASDLQGAAATLRQAIDIEPLSPAAAMLWSNLGVIRQQLGDPQGALAAVDSAAMIVPGSTTLGLARARALMALNRKQDAIDQYTVLAQRDSTLTEPQFYLGMIAFRDGDMDRAQAHFERLRALAPADESTHLAWASLYTARGLHRDAAREYRLLVDCAPEEEYLSGLTENLIALDELSEALETVNSAIQRYPDVADLYLLRAIINKRLYLYDDARADARQAVSLGASPAAVNATLNSF